MGNGPVEPSAAMRTMAATMRQMYLALMQEGFTRKEAMELIGIAINAGMKSNRDKDKDEE